MYDYKFRDNNLSFQKPKRHRHNRLWRYVGLAMVAAGFLYGFVQLDISGEGDSQTGETDSNVIRLQLPPRAEPEENRRPTGPGSSPAVEVDTTSADEDPGSAT
jgi:hypothetical protein